MNGARTPGNASMTDPTARHETRTGKRTLLQRWMALLRTVGNVQAWILLSVFYVVIVTPIGLLFRLTSDPLRLRRRRGGWAPLPSQYDRLEQAKEQS